MRTSYTPDSVRVTLLACVLAALIGLVLARAGTAQAAGVVGDGTPESCTGAALFAAITAGSGNISFNCGPNPVLITVTHVSGFSISSGNYNTIDGGNLVMLTAAGTNRLFDVRVSAALTLANIILTDGYQDGIHGNLPDVGGAILAEGLRLTLQHVTIRNSGSTDYGGGIEIITGTVLVQDSLIEGNQSGAGGGIDNASPISLISTLSLINTTVRANHALTNTGGGLNLRGTVIIDSSLIVDNRTDEGDGGGIYNRNASGSGSLTVNNSTLSGNSAAADGGGIYIYNGTATLNNSTLSGNSAMSTGGAISNANGGTLTLNNSTLSGNSASALGGGIFNNGSATLNNSTLSGNSAQQQGGGVFNYGTLTLNNSTLSGNSAQQQGGALYNASSAMLWNATVSNNSAGSGGALFMNSVATTLLTNTIVAYSASGGNCSGSVSTAQYSIDSDNTCALIPLGAGNQYANPLLTALGNYGGPTLVHMPETGSPAIDGVAGNDVSGNFDQRGKPRPVGAYDIGAVERQSGDSSLAPRLYLPLTRR